MFPSPARNTFRYTFSWCIAMALVFVPLLLWAAYDFYQSHRVDPVLALFTGAFGLLFAYAWLWTKTRATLHEEGFAYKSPFSEQDLRWAESTGTRDGRQPMNAGAHFGPRGYLIAAMARSNNEAIRTLEMF